MISGLQLNCFAYDLKMYAEIKSDIDADTFQCALDKLAALAAEWHYRFQLVNVL